jgi:phosphocarrier protein FPr
LLRNRAVDLRDVARRVLVAMDLPAVEGTEIGQEQGPGPYILVAENLSPSEAAQIDVEKIVGFCTRGGGATSHVAILARSLGLPAIAGVDHSVLALPDGTELAIDGTSGEIELKPTDEKKDKIKAWQTEQQKKREVALRSAMEPVFTRDRHPLKVHANIGNVTDLQHALKMGCDGVGLLRTELLFMDRAQAPSEDEQLGLYQQMADLLGEKPFTIRTLDIGGDKPLSYLPLPHEDNPFLGVRGLRIGLRQPEILRAQLRAILRVKSPASRHIMFPMVATLEEFLAAKAIVEDERRKLDAGKVEVGIMVEVPSAALIAPSLAEVVDFFSLGTNDLTQYTLAMDRGNQELTQAADGLHPAVLRLIEMSARAAHSHGRWIGVCGGLAGDPLAAAILLGLGIDELSVTPPTIPTLKAQIRQMNYAKAMKMSEQALQLATAAEVRELSSTFQRESGENHVDL